MSTAMLEPAPARTLLPARPRVQASLRVGAVDDPLEREADAVAERVLRMPDPGPALAESRPDGRVDSEEVRRCPGGCPPEGCQDEVAHRQPVSGGTSPGVSAPAVAAIQSRRDAGQPLAVSERSFFEPRLGAGLGRVRVHADAGAASLSRELGARAFTVGDDVFFGADQWRPSIGEGRRLLAHELAHVLQQRGTRDLMVRRQAAPQPPAQADDDGLDDIGPDELARAGVVALGTVLQQGLADEAEMLRRIYNEGAQHIAAEQERLLREVAAGRMTEEQVARQLSTMRHRLAVEVRRTGSALHRHFAELYDLVRGNVGRPTYETLRSRGRTNMQIIRSASRTDQFTNRLPGRMRWAGRGFWFVDAGISVFVVIDAPPDQRGAVAQDEVEGFVGGAGGSAAGAGICLATGVVTGGWGLIACGLLGGVAGATAAREFDLLELLDIAPHAAPGLAGRILIIEGEWDVTDLFIVGWVNRRVARSERIVVVSTGRVSGLQMSGRYGHYRSEEVIPANQAAVTLFGGRGPRWVRQSLLHPARPEELAAPED